MNDRKPLKYASPEGLRAYGLHTRSANFNTIGTHVRAHIDEVIAIMFLQKTLAGRAMFPGIQNAKIIFGFEDKEKNAQEWASQGVILVGIGNKNPFNEHISADNSEAYTGECAATMVAKYLGIHDKPETQQVMAYALFNDRNGDEGLEYTVKGNSILCPNRFLPGSLMKNFYSVCPETAKEMHAICFETWREMIYAVYLKDHNLHTEGKEEYEKGKIVGEAVAKLSQKELARRRKKDPNAKDEDTFKIFFVNSNSEFVLPYTRFRDKSIGVFICRQSTGHFQIHTSNRFQINLEDVVKILRRQHQEAKKNVLTKMFVDLKKPGTVPGAEEIYYNKEMEGIYNSSITHPDVVATPLSDDALIFAVKAALGKWFSKDHAKTCQTGVCAHKKGKECGFYRFGLSQCGEVIRKTKESENSNGQ